jgi:hypothetical protein
MQLKRIIGLFAPHFFAVFLFLILSIVYFYPVLEGKVMYTNDGTVAKNSSKEIKDYREEYGKEPLWTNSMFSGMPAYLISTKYKGNIMQYANTVLTILRLPVASIFLSMLGFYILLLIFKVDWRLSIAGAIVYGFSTYFFFILTAGHNTKAIAIAYMAPMIGGIYYTYKSNAIKGALITTFFLTLEILANHLQITYYSFLIILIFIITEFIFSIKRKEIVSFIKSSVILIIPILLSVGMNFSSLYTTYEYGKYSTRSKSELVTNDPNKTSGLDRDYITYWSYGLDETLTLLIPNFKGGASIPFDRTSETVSVLRKNNATQYVSNFQMYWGTQQSVGGPVYVGAIIIFLFVLGLIIVKGPEKWWLLVATLLSIMLAWGKNFMPFTNFFLDYFPGYNKFRAVTMTLVIAEFCIPLLGILALRDIFNGSVTKKYILKGIKITFGIIGGLTLIFVLFTGLAGSFISPIEQGQLPVWLSSALIHDRQSLLRVDALRSLIFIVIGVSVLLGFLYNKIKKEHAMIIFAVLFLFDMWSIDKRYVNAEKFVKPAVIEKALAPTKADILIMKDTSYYRVLNLSVSPFMDASTSLYHHSIGGYHGAKIGRYQELTDSVLFRDLVYYNNALNSAKSLEDLHPAIQRINSNNALNMLNTKYLIIDPQIAPILNNNALGNAWFIDTVIMVENANKELSQITKIDPSKQVTIDSKFKVQIDNSSFAGNKDDRIILISYKPNELQYKYSSKGERLVVFSEIYYPAGWKASIDGLEKDFFRADYVLRGMVVPIGDHVIKFSFEPSSFYIGNMISFASSLIFILLLIAYIIYSFKDKIQKPTILTTSGK